MIWILLVPIAILLGVRWLTRRADDTRQILMTDARRAEIIRLEQQNRS